MENLYTYQKFKFLQMSAAATHLKELYLNEMDIKYLTKLI